VCHGSYNRYDFDLSLRHQLLRLSKVGSWVDAYYMSMNVFNSSGTAFLGVEPFAFDRTQMLLSAGYRYQPWPRRRASK
jgi:hypothetical protein